MDSRRTKMRPLLERREKEARSVPTPGQARCFHDTSFGAVSDILGKISV